ncbi:MAG: amidohydrolase family protein, partial [Firmicutes bacterium]|nr:amidohydrolase family protein [Bacillota bacterium]
MKYDKLFVNGKIFTSDKDSPYAEAIAVKDGRIAWVGGDADAAAIRSEAEDIIDLGGNRMLPGFVDCHMHAMLLADFATQISALPPAIDSIEELVEAISEKREAQGPDAWIRGWGYDEGKLAEHRAPKRYDLDHGCSDAPVFVMRICAHM